MSSHGNSAKSARQSPLGGPSFARLCFAPSKGYRSQDSAIGARRSTTNSPFLSNPSSATSCQTASPSTEVQCSASRSATM